MRFTSSRSRLISAMLRFKRSVVSSIGGGGTRCALARSRSMTKSWEDKERDGTLCESIYQRRVAECPLQWLCARREWHP